MVFFVHVYSIRDTVVSDFFFYKYSASRHTCLNSSFNKDLTIVVKLLNNAYSSRGTTYPLLITAQGRGTVSVHLLNSRLYPARPPRGSILGPILFTRRISSSRPCVKMSDCTAVIDQLLKRGGGEGRTAHGVA